MTKPKHFPSPQFLRECFDYDPEAGTFRWRVRPLHHFVSERGQAACNGKFAGKAAFDHTNSFGYPKTNLTMDGVAFQILAHRAAWAIVYDVHPPELIDHVDGVKLNCKLSNLREAAAWQNGGNRAARKDKLKGAFWDAEHGRYRAILTAKGKRHHLGRFDTEAEAHAAYVAAATIHFGEFARAA